MDGTSPSFTPNNKAFLFKEHKREATRLPTKPGHLAADQECAEEPRILKT